MRPTAAPEPPPRAPASCRYRAAVVARGDGETAVCGLLVALTGLDDAGRCRVERAACESCCRAFPPTPEAINPAVASLLFALAARVESEAGAPGCGAARAASLKRRALAALPSAAPGAAGARPTAPRPSATTPLLRARLPVTARRGPGRVKTWAVGVTTAPRERPTLDLCLDSLARAGWPSPHLFVDAPFPLPARAAGLPSTTRDGRVGAWPNYALALHELLMREPRADAFLIAQDDALFYDREPLRDYLETDVLWPDPGPAVVSLYCPSTYTKAAAGWHPAGEPWGWGALAFVFPNELARAFLLDPAVFRHRWTGRSHGLAHIDVVVGDWAGRRGVTVWHPSPSLVQHVGETSTLWLGARANGDRRASWFAGDPPPPS